MKKCKKIFLIMAMAILCMLAVPEKEAQAGTETYPVKGYSCDELCRPSSGLDYMFEYVNELRMTPNVSYKNEDGTPCYPQHLTKLTYDYGLEAIAKQRAAEIAIRYAHTRPKGGKFDSLFSELKYNKGTVMGENIGIDNANVRTIYEAFEEANEDYNGQGHRRNMLNPQFKYVGYARLYVAGTFYTVQIFSSDSTGVMNKTEGNGYITQNVEVESGKITSFAPVVNIDSKYVDGNTWTIGINNEAVKLDTTKVCLYTSFTGDPNDEANAATLIPSDTNVTFGDNSLIEIDNNGYLCPKKSGTTTMTVTYKAINKTYTRTLKVDGALDFTTVKFVLEKNEDGTSGKYYFTGKPITPKLSYCRVGDSFPVEGIDYVLEYENNVDVGQATVRIKGIGGHTGSKTTTFDIRLKNSAVDINNCSVDAVPDQPLASGGNICPKVVVRDGNKILTERINYTLEYENNSGVGTARIYISGKNDYCGKRYVTFKIVKGNNAGTNNGSNNTGSSSNGTGTTTQSKKKVIFNANGGSCSTKSKSYTTGSQLSTLPKATRTGYTFNGWYTKKAGGKKVGSSTLVYGNATVYAQWTKVKVGKATISKLSVGKKKVTVTTKKVSGAKGYQIRYGTKKNMKGSKTVTTTVLKKTINKLKKGKRYYFQVRAYKKDSTGAKVYGSWSSKKQCKKVK